MIQINLSDEQAKRLLSALGWRVSGGNLACVMVSEEIAKEVFIQVENQVEAKRREERFTCTATASRPAIATKTA